MIDLNVIGAYVVAVFGIAGCIAVFVAIYINRR